VILGLDLLVMAVCFGYWEYRYQMYGWGRGAMKAMPRHAPQFPKTWPVVFDDDREIDIELPPIR
jgi:hypothetical protein